jgi:hypothetical protein
MPSGVSQEIAGSIFDDVNGAAIAPGGSVRAGTRLRLHTRGVSNGSGQTKNPDCTNGAVVERYASDIVISVDTELIRAVNKTATCC